MLLPRVFGEAGIAVVVTLARLVAYAIDNDQRWHRFVFLIFLALAVVAGWWMLADDGIQVLLHDFGRTLRCPFRLCSVRAGKMTEDDHRRSQASCQASYMIISMRAARVVSTPDNTQICEGSWQHGVHAT